MISSQPNDEPNNYESIAKKYVYLENIQSFPTRFGIYTMSCMRKITDQKLYIFKEFKADSKKQLKPLIEFLDEYDAFQEINEINYYLLSMKEKILTKNLDSDGWRLIIIQRDLRSFKLSRFRRRKMKELDIFVVLREIAKLYSFIIKSQFKNSLFKCDFLQGLNSKNIFYYPSNLKNKSIKLKREKLKVDVLDFIQEKPKQSLAYSVNSQFLKQNSQSELNEEKSHAFTFCGLIIELLFNAALKPGPKTEAISVSIKDLLKTKVGPCLRILFVQAIFSLKEKSTLDETEQWTHLLSNPILNQDLERNNDLLKWNITTLLKKKFEKFQVYQFRIKDGESSEEEKLKEKEEKKINKKEKVWNEKNGDENVDDEEEKTHIVPLIDHKQSELKASKNLNENFDERKKFWDNLRAAHDTINTYINSKHLSQEEFEILLILFPQYSNFLENGLILYKNNEKMGDNKDFRCFTRLRREFLRIKEHSYLRFLSNNKNK